MLKDQEFNFKKARIEKYLREEFERWFGQGGRISIRQRQRFITQTTRKIGRKFGKDVLCFLRFTKGGFASLVVPAHTESTDKGKLYRSFSHPDIYYTSHCLDRFSQRTNTGENCIIILDSLLAEALITYGEHEGYMVCSEGVFACETENARLIVKTFLNYELLRENQIDRFYSLNGLSFLPADMISENGLESDIVLAEEVLPPEKR
jgi:hypothetical protein